MPSIAPPRATPARPRLGARASLVALVLALVALAGCQVQVQVDTVVDQNGAGTVTVAFDNSATNATSACSPTGTWAANAPALAEGAHTATATQASALGTSNTRSFTIDITAPTVTLASPANGATLTNSTVTFSGTCSEVGTNNVSVAVTGPPSPTLVTSCIAPGTWSVNQALPNHAYTATASHTDPAGNVGTSATHTEFADNLIAGGWSVRKSADGVVQIFEKDGARYVLRDKADSYGGWSADYYASGSTTITLKVRLGYP